MEMQELLDDQELSECMVLSISNKAQCTQTDLTPCILLNRYDQPLDSLQLFIQSEWEGMSVASFIT